MDVICYYLCAFFGVVKTSMGKWEVVRRKCS